MFLFKLAVYTYVVQEVLCLNFDVKNAKRINLGTKDENTYFGYAVLLQRGLTPMVIVGAPKADNHTGGAVYSCILGDSCKKYDNLFASNQNTFTSNFLGSAVDGSDISGEEIIVCAPRTVSEQQVYQKGLCFYHKNTTKFTIDQKVIINSLAHADPTHYTTAPPYYDYGYAQAGFSLHYINGNKEILLGAPGVKSWSGSVIKQSLSNINKYDELPSRKTLISKEEQGYLGYSVTSGTFQLGSTQEPHIVIGGPRANNLHGLVNIYKGTILTKSLTNNDESSTYYGSAVLGLDVNNDGIDELFVGAPCSPGNTYDEGYVYFYGNNFENKYKLVGSQKIAARFGSAIASLGDIDYDSYNDVAISAPYEDDGVGAVYIYMGSKNGVQQSFSQRLSPLLFDNGLKNARGFGMGLSRGNDLDNNGHNDLAVGAYQTGEVFLFYGLSIIDFKLTLTTNISVIKGDTVMNVTSCVFFSQRSPAQDHKISNFLVELTLDYRTDGKISFENTWSVLLKQQICQVMDVKIKESPGDILPYKLSLKGKSVANVIAKGESQIEKSLPYAHGCGGDNRCQTKVTISFVKNTSKIIVSKDKEVTIEIIAKNVGETGYQCRLEIKSPESIELSQNSLCTLENETYVCPFASTLKTEKQASYQFDVSTVSPTTEKLDFDFEIKCLGENLADGTAKVSYLVSLQNSPYIEGKSDPDKIYFQRSQPEKFEVTHLFSVGNSGPSPVKQDITIIVPIVQFENKDIFEFSKVTLNGFQSNCTPPRQIDEYLLNFYPNSVMKKSFNGTIVYTGSSSGTKHIEISCSDGYLQKSSQIARYQVIFTVKTNLIGEMYKKGILKENVIVYITTAFLSNITDKIGGYAATFIQSTEEKSPLLWVYILIGVILGLILLALMIYLLYKCHFFDRRLREKMNDQNLVNEQNEGNEGEVEVDLRNSDENDLNSESHMTTETEGTK